MKQEDRWNIRYNEVLEYIESNKRIPPKYVAEERNMLNWCKQQRKVMNAGKLKEERGELFSQLMALMEQYKRKNQYD